MKNAGFIIVLMFFGFIILALTRAGDELEPVSITNVVARINKGEITKIEVKSDRQAGRTGNLCIEYECNGKPSGITSTEADYYMYFIVYAKEKDAEGLPREECYNIPVDELKQIVKSCKKVRGGDGDRSLMYLLNKSLVQQYLINKIPNFNNKYNIKPSMSKVQPTTNNDKPLSYSKRLIKEFEDHTKDTFDLSDIMKVIEDYSAKEYEKRKQKTDEMPFGKYKYKKVADVAKFDKQYLKWLVRQDMMTNYAELKANIEKLVN